MRCCWGSCQKRATWFVTNTWDGVVNFVVCDVHMVPLTNAYPSGKFVLSILSKKTKNKESNDSTD